MAKHERSWKTITCLIAIFASIFVIFSARLSASAEPFAIVVIPDTRVQVWERPGANWPDLDYWAGQCDASYSSPPYLCNTNFTEMIQWIVDNATAEDIKLVTHSTRR